jgi:hypothetical protein
MKKFKYLILLCTVGLISSCGGSSDPGLASGSEDSYRSDYTDRPFPDSNPWNQDISNEQVDPNSDVYINSLGRYQTVHPDFGTWWNGAPLGQPFVTVSGSQRKVPVTFDYASDSDPGPYPIPANAPIQGGPNGAGDRHVIVVDNDNGLLYEMYGAYPNGDGSWRALSGAVFDLKSNKMRPDGHTSADAAGLPIYPGLMKYEEVVVKKEVTHAVRFTANRTRNAYVYPATHGSSNSNDPSLPPMGMRVRLKKNFDISGYPQSVQVILRGLKKYGMILADNGESWMISGAPNDNWNDYELHTIKQVPGDAFEVVKMGPVTPVKY